MKTSLWLVVVLLALTCGPGAYGFSPVSETKKTELMIYDLNGYPLGTIKNSLVDAEGDIVFIILALGTEADQSRKEIIVPLSAFSFDETSSLILLRMSAEQVAAAPEFHFSDLRDPSFGEKIYEFYGETPGRKQKGIGRILETEEVFYPI